MSIRILKFIQINVYKGQYLDALVDFLNKENPDFVSMQEVSSGVVNLYGDKTSSLFAILKQRLDMEGVYFADTVLSDSNEAGFGNAVFSRFPIRSKHVEVLKNFGPITRAELFDSKLWPGFARHILDAIVDVVGFKIHVMSLHGAWTAPPTDTEETVRQAGVIADYLKSLGDEPFILGCDLNNVPDSRVTETISAVANNLMLGSGVRQTTHPKIHKIAPRGFMIDYIFCSRHFAKKSLVVPEIMVSDHLPVVAQLEFSP